MARRDEIGAGSRRAVIVGTGLIGGSIGLQLRQAGWHVTGRDSDPTAADRARDLGALDVVGHDATADLTFVATPVGVIAREVERALDETTGLVTDVGSVKTPMLELMSNPRYVGGHPMAGSELEGVAGARPDLFEGTTWVLTPTVDTDDQALTTVRSVVASLGADVVSLPPDRHDAMVALVSHVPHLTAATLMTLADERSNEQRALLRLAAGGFRDMTRVAAGHPGIWPDICVENRAAIVGELDQLIAALGDMRDVVEKGDRDGLVGLLARAREARVAMPARIGRPEELAEIRVPIPDRTGVLAEITTLATDLDVSIADIEIAHSAEGDEGVLILLVEAELGDQLAGGLVEAGFKPSVHRLR
jgi:prephenate dehydrogenase